MSLYRALGNNLAPLYEEEAPTFYMGCSTPNPQEGIPPAHDFLSGYTTPGPTEREASRYFKVFDIFYLRILFKSKFYFLTNIKGKTFAYEYNKNEEHYKSAQNL